jgi:hypothetical protein
MTDSKMPAKVWLRVCGGGTRFPGHQGYVTVTGDSIEAEGRTVYIRADLVEPLVEALRECVELFGDIRSDFSDPRSVCDKGRDIAEAAILRARQAADTERAK